MRLKISTKQELIDILEFTLDRVKADDSFQGNITYDYMMEKVKPPNIGLEASIRFGNQEGQGAIRLIQGEPDPTPKEMYYKFTKEDEAFIVKNMENVSQQVLLNVTCYMLGIGHGAKLTTGLEKCQFDDGKTLDAKVKAYLKKKGKK